MTMPIFWWSQFANTIYSALKAFIINVLQAVIVIIHLTVQNNYLLFSFYLIPIMGSQE